MLCTERGPDTDIDIKNIPALYPKPCTLTLDLFSYGKLDRVLVLQVYSWGSNMCGQLGHVNSSFVVPQQAKVR